MDLPRYSKREKEGTRPTRDIQKRYCLELFSYFFISAENRILISVSRKSKHQYPEWVTTLFISSAFFAVAYRHNSAQNSSLSLHHMYISFSLIIWKKKKQPLYDTNIFGNFSTRLRHVSKYAQKRDNLSINCISPRNIRYSFFVITRPAASISLPCIAISAVNFSRYRR